MPPTKVPDKFAFDAISRATFDALLTQYPEVLPAKIRELDEERYKTIPGAVDERRQNGDAHLTKEEAFALVSWKLSHGKFRPTLKALLQQNSPDAVLAATRAGFKLYKPDALETVKPALDALTLLRGIGPATASLFLSTYAPASAPFFSVGVFGWATNKEGHGREWEAGIKYNLKEYLEIYERVASIRERLGVDAVDVEKAGYVLGHTVMGGRATKEDGEKMTKKRKEEMTNEDNDNEQDKDVKKATRSSKRRK